MTPNLQPTSESRGPQSRAGSAPQLRDYQVAALAAIRAELEHHRSTLVVAATGTGKTVTFAEEARQVAALGGRTLILVHRDELIKQARKKCEAAGLWPDVEKGKQRASTLSKVVIASVQSMKGARLARWARDHFARIIVDEAHHAAATSYRTVLDYFDAKIIGFTATPDRADGKALGDVFETVAFRYEIRQAIAEGYLVPITARRVVVESVDLSGVSTRAGDFAQDQLAEIMADERALRGVAVPLLELARDRLTIAFCVDVAHAEKMAAVMNGYRPGCARAVSGETDDADRERLLSDHASGVFQFLFNCEVLVEGYDCPEVSCVAMIRPTKSRGRLVQCAGRGLRPSPESGKADCLLLDFTGTAGRHSLAGPADCLIGSGRLEDDVRAELDRLLGSAQRDLEVVIAHAEDEVAKRREAMRISAVVRYHEEQIDPFIGAPASSLPPCDRAWTNDPVSGRQLDALEKDGITVAKLPPNFSRADAWSLLARIRERPRLGLCSYKAARKLAQAGVADTRGLTHDRAKKLLDKLREGGWRPSAIADEPEVKVGRVPALRGVA